MSLGFSSCFDILEEYSFNRDGSGTGKMTVDMSQMIDMMAAFGSALDSTKSGEDNSIDEMFAKNEAVESLKRIPGISNVKDLNNRDDKTIGYSFDFANIEALNTAMIAGKENLGLSEMMGGESEENETERENSFSLAGKKFKRVMDMKMDEKAQDDEDGQYMEMAMAMFQNNNYTIIYNFDRQVKKVKGNDAALISADGKSVTIKNSLGDLLKGTGTNSCELKLK
jgi:hypothetical protein